MGYFYHNELYDNKGKRKRICRRKIRRTKRGENEREKRETKRKSKKALGSSLLDNDSSVEVGYGLFYVIVNSK